LHLFNSHISGKEIIMAVKMPSLTALLGLVAVAGYQNRDKIGEFVKSIAGGASASNPAAAAIPGGLAGALGGLVTQLNANGLGDAANSWVGKGPNAAVTGGQLNQALGPDIIAAIAAKTGLSADVISGALAQVLPQVVDGLTPNGEIPPEPK
jgi:uncharacterized protein YidB (DUF937 family)